MISTIVDLLGFHCSLHINHFPQEKEGLFKPLPACPYNIHFQNFHHFCSPFMTAYWIAIVILPRITPIAKMKKYLKYKMEVSGVMINSSTPHIKKVHVARRSKEVVGKCCFFAAECAAFFFRSTLCFHCFLATRTDFGSLFSTCLPGAAEGSVIRERKKVVGPTKLSVFDFPSNAQKVPLLIGFSHTHFMGLPSALTSSRELYTCPLDSDEPHPTRKRTLNNRINSITGEFKRIHPQESRMIFKVFSRYPKV